MIPVLSHIEIYKNLPIWMTSDGKCGLAFEIFPCDLETGNIDEFHQRLTELLRYLDPKVLARIKFTSKLNNTHLNDSLRKKSIADIGYNEASVNFIVEIESEPQLVQLLKRAFKNKENEDKSLEALVKVHNQIKLAGLSAKIMSEGKTKELFVNPQNQWKKCDSSIHTGTSRIGVVRLVKPANFQISESSFANALRNLPRPFNVHISFKRLNSASIKLELERKLKQSSSDTTLNPSNSVIQQSTIEALTMAIKDGSQFLEYELLITLERNSESELSSDLSAAHNLLNSIGEFQIETFGAAASFLATLPGNSQHVTLKELDSVLPFMIPLWISGEPRKPEPSKSSLLLHRTDKSVFNFNLFNSKYSVYNSLIIGTSGKGKSVLTGLLTQSLLNDPSNQVIKIDVGGSHSKECNLLGGKEFVLELNKPSGINPFQILEDQRISDSDKISILSRFLIVLIQEQGEVIITKDLRSKVELSVQEYIQTARLYTLQEFYEHQTEFPRRNLLRRWVSGGVYENAFAGPNIRRVPDVAKHNTSNFESRLRYYNFSQIFQASDPEFAQAGLAAVLAQFNFEALININSRIILICDETPFFIKSCFEFFKFSTANVRKYGHAVVLVAQLSTDLIVDGDTGLIENSPQRFLFSVDGNSSQFQDRFNLSEEKIAQIKSLRAVPEKYSEVLFQSGDTSRVLKIEVTREEYWALTSSKQDQDKLNHLLLAVPNLTLKEAIKCLSLT